MKRRMYLRTALFVIIIGLTMTGCQNEKEVIVPKAIQEYVSDTNASHLAIQPKQLALDPFKKADEGSKAYYEAMDYVLSHSARTNGEPSVTQAEALSDVQDLFTLLKPLYGMYPSYGETAFQKAQQEIEHTLKKQASIKKEELGAILRAHLSFLNDEHFAIDYYPLHKRMRTYRQKEVTYQNQVYMKKGTQFYEVKTQKRIVSINDNQVLTDSLKPILHNDGTISYQLFLQSDQKLQEVELTYEDGSVSHVLMTPCETVKTEDILQEDVLADIPYLHLTKMIYPRMNESYQEAADRFLMNAKTFAQSPIAILDLRGNTGGNAMLSYAWSHAYTNQKLSGYGTRVLRLPLEEKNFSKLMQKDTDQSLQALLDHAAYQKQDTVLYVEQPYSGSTLVKQKSILLVLQDELSASASEMLIDQLHTVENVIFIGTASNGAISGSAMSTFYLDKSGLAVMFGNLYGEYPKEYAQERYGIAPDIWVDGKDTLAYIQYLKKSCK